jgi:hypothetical protein
MDRMLEEGVPARIDRSYLTGMSGGTQNQVKAALRSLGLMDDDGAPTVQLRSVVERPTDRPAIIAEMLRERFPDLVSLGENATRGQLDEVLVGYGLSGATARKAASFFVQAAEYANLPLSPHIRSRKRTSGATSGRRSSGRTTRRQSSTSPDKSPPDGNTETLELVSGGVVTLSVSVNLFELSRNDRDFVLGLIDKIKDYDSDGDRDGSS